MTEIVKGIIGTARYIKEIHYFSTTNKYFDEIFNVSCRLGYGSDLEEVTILFENACDFTVSIGEKTKQLGILNVVDVSDEGWETRKYLVRDLEPNMEDDFKLMCDRIIILE